MKTEYAGPGRGVSSAYEGLARWAGVPLATVVEYAREDRLNDLVESRQFTRPLSGAEALRRLEQRRHDPTAKPRSPHALIGELRAWMTIWDAELAEEERQRRQLLVELRARQVPPWWD